ncbi:MAG: hypothetical protein Q9225_006475 [Loekoesia sp. 1 TL-2023]
MFESHASYSESSRAQTIPNPTQTQADHERHIQDVLIWSNSKLIVPQSGNDPANQSDDRHGFVPRSQLDSEFLKPGRIEELLDALFGTSRQCRPRAETIPSGASAAISRIEIHPDYDQLHDEKVRSIFDGVWNVIVDIIKDPNAQNSHTYALKTYETPQAEAYYKAERNAFDALSSAANRQENNIISYYGSFTRVNAKREDISFNTILEFAEYGTLEDFMKNTDPPSTAEGSITFWERFLEVTRGLAVIHGRAPTDARMEDAILLGWYQDVKPKNILVCQNRNPSSKYDHTFKLADLGLSHFKMHVRASHSVTDLDTFGTRTYGAPEVHRNPRRLASLHLDAKQGVDIWSMGCVLSEVAVWLVHGYQYLGKYRRRRSAEFHKQSGENPTNCFHDGCGNVLDLVKKTHKDLPDNFRIWDLCTGEVLARLVSRMVMAKTEARPPALFIYEEFREIIEGVKNRMNGRLTEAENRLFSNIEQPRPKLPPNLPPGHELKIQHQAYESPFNQETRLWLNSSLDRAKYEPLPHSHVSSSSGSPPQTTRSYRNENPLQAQSSRHTPTFIATEYSTQLVPAA